MSTIGFIGLGNMGGPMVSNLIEAGHSVAAFDIVPDAVARAVAAGATAADSATDAAADAEVVITMLPAGQHVRAVYIDVGLADAGQIRWRPVRRAVFVDDNGPDAFEQIMAPVATIGNPVFH